MAEIHATTLTPGKLELLGRWLPDQSWYVDTGDEPDLQRVGGFRLDDPAGLVGMEFMFVTDTSRETSVTYHVPMTYRGEPLPAADAALIGTSEHGVLGRRWIYDGARDPVLVAQLLALVQGEASPQHQTQSHTPDPDVTVERLDPGSLTACSFDSSNEPAFTAIHVQAREADGARCAVTIDLVRVLDSRDEASSYPDDVTGRMTYVSAPWRKPDGVAERGPVIVVKWPSPAPEQQ